MTGLLYLLAAADRSQVKIGITRDDASLRGRLAALGGRGRFDLSMSRVFRCADNYAIEQFLHLLVADCKIESEAFIDGAGKTECFKFDAYTRVIEFLAGHGQLVTEIHAPFAWQPRPSSESSAEARARVSRREEVRRHNIAALAVFDAVWDSFDAPCSPALRMEAGGCTWLARVVPCDGSPIRYEPMLTAAKTTGQGLSAGSFDAYDLFDHQGQRWHLARVDPLTNVSESDAPGVGMRWAKVLTLPAADARAQPFTDAFYQARWGRASCWNAEVCAEVEGVLAYLASLGTISLHRQAGKAFLVFKLSQESVATLDHTEVWDFMRLHLMGVLHLPRVSCDPRCASESIVCFPSSWVGDRWGYVEVRLIEYAITNPMQMLWDSAVASLLHRFMMLPPTDVALAEQVFAAGRLANRRLAKELN